MNRLLALIFGLLTLFSFQSFAAILYQTDFDSVTGLNLTKSTSPTNPSVSADFAYGVALQPLLQ